MSDRPLPSELHILNIAVPSHFMETTVGTINLIIALLAFIAAHPTAVIFADDRNLLPHPG